MNKVIVLVCSTNKKLLVNKQKPISSAWVVRLQKVYLDFDQKYPKYNQSYIDPNSNFCNIRGATSNYLECEYTFMI